MKYVRMYTDEAGETHFEDVEVASAPQAFAPPTEPVHVSDPAPAARILFVRIPRGWFGDWHATPKRQFNTTIQGELEITMSDGESRVFGAGAVRLMEDTTGKGHQTRVVGDADVVSLIAQTE